MPLRWKKAQISQLVADHIHSRSRRGGSLVVETGFPTSLIDLFVKNRDRLKKPSKKKNKRFDCSDPTPPTLSPSPPVSQTVSPGLSDLSPAISRTESLGRCVSVSDSVNSKRNSSNSSSGIDDEITSDDTARVSISDYENSKSNSNSTSRIGDDEVPRKDVIRVSKKSGGDDDDGGIAADSNGVFLGILKVALVVILALSTKKMTVGITISAILLIFLEFVGKSLGSMIQRFLCFFRIKQEKKIMGSKEEGVITQEDHVDSGCSGSIAGCESDVSKEEIRVLTPIVGVECVRGEFKVDKEENWVNDATETKARRSRRARIKSNMTKLVPKKLRGSKKKRTDSKSDTTSSVGEVEVVKCDEHKEEGDGESSSLLSSERSAAVDVDDNNELVRIEVVETVVETQSNSESSKRNSGYLIFFLIVLVGLVGGRVLAVLVTIIWCLMMKSAGTLRRYVKVPMIVIAS